MARAARVKSESGIYHVMIRGINRQDIFHEDEDRHKFIEIMKKVKELSQCEIYAYCLMGNHVHLLIKEGIEKLSQIMKRLGTSYAYWYNYKYERTGHLFQDRYRSEAVEDDTYFLSVLRYIHQNPVKAEIVNSIGKFTWSSFHAYLKPVQENKELIDIKFALGLFGSETSAAVENYIQYMEQSQQFIHIDDNKRKKCTDEEVKNEFIKLMGTRASNQWPELEKWERDEILQKLKQIEGSSIRQIERVTGIGRNIIAKA